MHITNNIDDSYMGSGHYLLRAIKKYGKKKFKKETLFVFNNKKSMVEKEKELIEHFRLNNNTYNIADGGIGGNTGKRKKASREKSSISAQARFKRETRKERFDRIKITKKASERYFKNEPIEKRTRRSIIHSGYKWIYNEKLGKLKKVKQKQLKQYLGMGWDLGLGRKFKESRMGKNNPMYGKSVYSFWVKKYGKKEANRRKKYQVGLRTGVNSVCYNKCKKQCPAYGSRWMYHTNPKREYFVKQNQIKQYLNNGFSFGRPHIRKNR